jgi:phosphoenolpyruvate-protein phosphotransferase (PTS system enzyme I)
MPSVIVGPAFRELESPKSSGNNVILSVSEELRTLRRAFDETKRWFREMDEQVEDEQKAFHDAILFYLTILDDQDLIQAIVKRIEKRQESCVDATSRIFDDARKKMKSGDPYFQNRVYDLNDVESRLVQNMTFPLADEPKQSEPSVPFVLFVKELTISSVSRYSFDRLLAVVADSGGYNSHAAIILQANQIPFLIIPDTLRHVADKEEVLVDFRVGTVLFRPTNRQIAKSKSLAKTSHSAKTPSIRSPLTIDERIQLHLWPAVNHLRETADPILSNHEGIGLFRSEFLIFEQETFPDESVQYDAYLTLSNAVSGKPVYIRLFDIEPDKTLPFVKSKAFGAAFLIQNQEILETQLRALLRLSLIRPVGITIPMVRNQDEIESIRKTLIVVQDEIRKTVPEAVFQVELGAMIETAAMTHGIKKLNHLDFLQIGTNDLLSSLLEVSRDSTDFSPNLFFDPLFLRMLKRLIADTESKRIPVSLCGEAANHPPLVPLLIAMGYRRFVPGPTHIESTYGSLDSKRIEELQSALPSLLGCESLIQVQKKMRFL